MDARGDDRAVHLRDALERLFVLARDDLHDLLERVFLVAGVDALWRVAEEVIDPVLEAALVVENRAAHFFGDARVHRRLEHDDIALLEMRTDRLARADHRSEVRTI